MIDKYKMNYKNCMLRECEHCRYKQYCFKKEVEYENSDRQHRLHKQTKRK